MPSASRRVRASIKLDIKNPLPLIAVLGLNLAILILVAKTGRLLAPGIDHVAKQWRDFLPAGVGVVFAGVFNGLLSSESKARCVLALGRPTSGQLCFFALRAARSANRCDCSTQGSGDLAVRTA